MCYFSYKKLDHFTLKPNTAENSTIEVGSTFHNNHGNLLINDNGYVLIAYF